MSILSHNLSTHRPFAEPSIEESLQVDQGPADLIDHALDQAPFSLSQRARKEFVQGVLMHCDAALNALIGKLEPKDLRSALSAWIQAIDPVARFSYKDACIAECTWEDLLTSDSVVAALRKDSSVEPYADARSHALCIAAQPLRRHLMQLCDAMYCRSDAWRSDEGLPAKLQFANNFVDAAPWGELRHSAKKRDSQPKVFIRDLLSKPQADLLFANFYPQIKHNFSVRLKRFCHTPSVRDEAEWLAQDRVLRSMRMLSEHSAPQAVIYTICKRAIIDTLRGRKIRAKYFAPVATEDIPESSTLLPCEVPDDMRSATAHDISRALETLENDELDIFLMRNAMHMTFKQIASRMHTNYSAVYAAYDRVRGKVRSFLEGRGYTP